MVFSGGGVCYYLVKFGSKVIFVALIDIGVQYSMEMYNQNSLLLNYNEHHRINLSILGAIEEMSLIIIYWSKNYRRICLCCFSNSSRLSICLFFDSFWSSLCWYLWNFKSFMVVWWCNKTKISWVQRRKPMEALYISLALQISRPESLHTSFTTSAKVRYKY